MFKNLHNPDSSTSWLWNPAVLVWDHSANTIVEQNVFINCDRAIAFGLQVPSSGTTDHSGGTIRNNFVYMQPGFLSSSRTASSDGQILVWDSPSSLVYNNTIITNGSITDSIQFRFVTTGAEAKNNLTDSPIATRDGGTYAQSNNYLSATPGMFVNPTNADLHLVSNTATNAYVISHGATLSSVTNDIDDDTRPSGAGYEIGADECVAGALPAAPTGLRLQ